MNNSINNTNNKNKRSFKVNNIRNNVLTTEQEKEKNNKDKDYSEEGEIIEEEIDFNFCYSIYSKEDAGCINNNINSFGENEEEDKNRKNKRSKQDNNDEEDKRRIRNHFKNYSLKTKDKLLSNNSISNINKDKTEDKFKETKNNKEKEDLEEVISINSEDEGSNKNVKTNNKISNSNNNKSEYKFSWATKRNCNN